MKRSRPSDPGMTETGVGEIAAAPEKNYTLRAPRALRFT
jgi:hypothetical protein